MSRRYVSIWLARWPTDRLRLSLRRRAPAEASRLDDTVPLALTTSGKGGLVVSAVDEAAARRGIDVGLKVADARAICPALALRPAEPEADAGALEALTVWCGRYSPWTAPDGPDGIVLDVTGCAHLFGGEAQLLDDIEARLHRLGIAARTAAADRPAAAWAWARFGPGGPLPSGRAKALLGALPAAALRLPAETVAGLAAMGLRRIGQICALPSAPLAARFGETVLERLDALLGEGHEPISPILPQRPLSVRLTWPEAIGRAEDVEAATRDLLGRLCRILESERKGARRLDLDLCRVDRRIARLTVETSLPSRDPKHLLRLFLERLDGIDLGFGVEMMLLSAEADLLAPRQIGIGTRHDGSDGVGQLVDRLAGRLGRASVARPEPVASHVPERAERMAPPLARPGRENPWRTLQPRPLRVLAPPEPIEAMAKVPDDPPIWFRWRRRTHRVVLATGPERIASEWWRNDATAARPRDYYRLEDEAGLGFWVFRAGLYGEGPQPAWFMHGMFG